MTVREARLLGRSQDLDVLRSCLEDAGSGRGQVVLIEGEAGIGKSRLLGEVLGAAGKRGFQTFCGGAGELDGPRPFRALAGALDLHHRSTDPRRAAIGRLLRPEDSREMLGLCAGTQDPGFRVLEQVMDLLEGFANEGAIALALEDLHWSDASTLTAVPYIGRRLADLPIVLLATFRPFPRVPDLDRIVGHLLPLGAVHLTLGPLDTVTTAALAEELVGVPPGPRLGAQLEATGGNPLFVVELVEALRKEGAINLAEGYAEVPDVQVPRTLRQTILRRLSSLSRETLELLRLGSVLGNTFSVRELTTILKQPFVHWMRALHEATEAGVLGETGSHLAFRHDLIREAIYQELPRPLRMGLHREAASALAADGAPTAQVAKHLVLGATHGDTKAVAWLHQAARETVTRAPGPAVELLQRALELLEPSDPRCAGLLVDLVAALAWSGRLAEAEALGRQALACPQDSHVRAALGRNLAEALLLAGRMQEGREELEQAAADPGLGGHERSRLLAEAAIGAMHCGDLRGADALAREGAQLGERFGDDVAVSLGLCTSSWVANLRGDFPESVRLAQAAVDRASRSQRQSVEALRRNPHFFLSVVLLRSDRVAEGEEAIRTCRRQSEQLGTVWTIPLVHWTLAFRHFLGGDWDDAVAEIEAGLAFAEEFGCKAGKVWPHSILANIAVHRDDLPAAERALDEARRAVAETGVQLGISWMLWAQALLEEARGNAGSALSLLEAAWDLENGYGNVSEYPMLGPDLVRLARAAGNIERAHAVAKAVGDAAERMERATAEGAALRCRGLLLDDPTVLLQSVAVYRRGPRPIELAFACEDAGRALSSAGRSSEGVALLMEALETYERVAALRDAARVSATLRLLGARRGCRGRRSRPSTGWESLTASEQKVVSLVVEGLGNSAIARRLCISRYTVETHLKHIFGKLGVSSRVDLAVDAARRSISARSA